MKGDGNFKWWWAAGPDFSEVYNGPHDTREEAIEEGHSQTDGVFHVTEADRAVPDFNVFSVDRIAGDFEERNEECWGEDGADWSTTAGQDRELEKALAETFEKWVKAQPVEPFRVFNFGEMRSKSVHGHDDEDRADEKA